MRWEGPDRVPRRAPVKVPKIVWGIVDGQELADDIFGGLMMFTNKADALKYCRFSDREPIRLLLKRG